MHGYTAKTGRRQLHTHAYLPVAPRVLGGSFKGLGYLLQPSPIADRLTCTLSEGVQEHGVLEFAIAYRARGWVDVS